MNNKEMTDKDLEQKVEPTETSQSAQESSSAEQQEMQEEIESQENMSEVEVELDPFEKLQIEYSSLNDRFLRLVAEFDNFKKRAAKEKNEIRLTGGRDILEDILPVLDDLDRAQEVVEKATDVQAVKEGFDLIKDKLLKTLASKGLKEMEVLGEEFSADRHEAVAEFPAPTEDAKGKVFDVTAKGYVLNDRIIRFPKVVVSK